MCCVFVLDLHFWSSLPQPFVADDPPQIQSLKTSAEYLSCDTWTYNVQKLVMMLAKRRLTLTRSVYLGITTVLLLLLIFFSKNYPLDIITQHQASVLGGILSRNKPQSEPHPDLAGPKRTESFSACHLYQLHREKTATRGDTVASQCHRVPPVPGSCDVAERLFHSSPPGHCDDQGTVEICTVKVSWTQGS